MSRVRTRGPLETMHDKSYQEDFEQWQLSPLKLLMSGTDPKPWQNYATRRTEQMTDVITPGFYTKMRQGVITNNPMERIVTWNAVYPPYVSATVTGACTRYKDICKAEGWCNPYASPWTLATTYMTPAYCPASSPSVNEQSMVDQAVSQAFARISESPLNLWVVIGEARETIEMLIWYLKAARTLLSPKRALIRELRKRTKTGKFITWSDLGAARDLWLNVRYGLRPLIYDIKGALEALDNIGTKVRARYTSDRFEVSSKTFHTEQWVDFGINQTLHVKKTGYAETVYTARAGVLVEPELKTHTLAELIDTSDLVAGLWDLVPYSFVVDWFANTADVIASYNTISGLCKPVASWIVTEKTVTFATIVKPETLYATPFYSGRPVVPSESGWHVQSGKVESVTVTKTRTPNPGKPQAIHLDVRLSKAKTLDLLALASNFKKMKYW